MRIDSFSIDEPKPESTAEVFRIVHASDFHFASDSSFTPAPRPTLNRRCFYKRRELLNYIRGNFYCIKHAINHCEANAAHSHAMEKVRNKLTNFGLSIHNEQYSPNIAAALKAYVRAQQSPPVDLFLVTGDAATTGCEADLREAANYFFSQGRMEWDIPVYNTPYPSKGEIANLDRPTFVFPGNHDRQDRERFLFPKRGEFEKIFRGDWAQKVASKTKHNEDVWEVVIRKDNQSLAILGADFSLRKAFHSWWGGTLCGNARGAFWGMWGRGKAYTNTIRKLKERTAQLRQAGHAVIWASHFPPARQLSVQDSTAKYNVPSELMLSRGTDLIKAARDLNVEYILCGHVHLAGLTGIGSALPNNNVYVITTGSASATPQHFGGTEENSFLDIGLSVDNGRVEIVRISKIAYNPKKNCFPEQGSILHFPLGCFA